MSRSVVTIDYCEVYGELESIVTSIESVIKELDCVKYRHLDVEDAREFLAEAKHSLVSILDEIEGQAWGQASEELNAQIREYYGSVL